MPESPRYLVLNGKEHKAKKVLALIAKINCKPPLSGRLVTLEEKEQLLGERNQPCVPDEQSELLVVRSENHSVETEADNTSYIAQPNKEKAIDSELTVISSDNESDGEMLLEFHESTHKRILSWKYIKHFIRNKFTKYYHWLLILFKNGYWKTTILLWYLW